MNRPGFRSYRVPCPAVALGHSASKKHFDELAELLRDDNRGNIRVMFIPPIIRIGRERGWEVIESLADDPDVGREACRYLHRRDLRRKAKARREARG